MMCLKIKFTSNKKIKIMQNLVPILLFTILLVNAEKLANNESGTKTNTNNNKNNDEKNESSNSLGSLAFLTRSVRQSSST